MSDYSDLIERLREIASAIENDAEDAGAFDEIYIGRAKDIDKAADAIATLEQTVSDYAEMIDKLKEGISFIQLHQSKRARK